MTNRHSFFSVLPACFPFLCSCFCLFSFVCLSPLLPLWTIIVHLKRQDVDGDKIQNHQWWSDICGNNPFHSSILSFSIADNQQGRSRSFSSSFLTLRCIYTFTLLFFHPLRTLQTSCKQFYMFLLSILVLEFSHTYHQYRTIQLSTVSLDNVPCTFTYE